MNFTSLDYFIALVQEKSYTKAAQRLHVTQQTLSAHIAALEKEMNCKLVIRQIPLDFTIMPFRSVREKIRWKRKSPMPLPMRQAF